MNVHLNGSAAFAWSRSAVFVLGGFAISGLSIVLQTYGSLIGVLLVFIGLGRMMYFSYTKYLIDAGLKTIEILQPFNLVKNISLSAVRGYRIEQPLWMQFFHANRLSLRHLSGKITPVCLPVNFVPDIEKQLAIMNIVKVISCLWLNYLNRLRSETL